MNQNEFIKYSQTNVKVLNNFKGFFIVLSESKQILIFEIKKSGIIEHLEKRNLILLNKEQNKKLNQFYLLSYKENKNLQSAIYLLIKRKFKNRNKINDYFFKDK